MINVSIDNVTYSGDATSTRFLFCGSEMPGCGVNNVRMTNCTVTNARYGIKLTCPINRGLINGNIFDKIGSSDVYQNVSAIMLGFPNSNVVYARNITISDNRITNVTSAYSIINDGRECQGILLYSDGGCVIKNNYIHNITGGEDTEGIYCKAVDVKILNNTLVNAGEGDGSIVVKKDSEKNDIIISGNEIYNYLETKGMICGIHITGSKFTISNNRISMISGIALYKDKSTETLDAVITDNSIVICGRTAFYINDTSGKTTITGNSITLIQNSNEKTDAAINLVGTKKGGIVQVENNKIYTENTVFFNLFRADEKADISIQNNILISNIKLSDKAAYLTDSNLYYYLQ
jgi:hypothetical protein